MTRWLVITLKAPLASFGERAGNVERSTSERPTRSALLGLAGAALGIRRDDKPGQSALAKSFRVATQTVDAGSLVSDFHTYQSLPSAKGKPATRAEALARRGDLATSITRREYRSDVWFEAAYAAQDGARWSLEELAGAFAKPHFILFLGRKSCPLAAPLTPEIIDATDLVGVFRQRHSSVSSYRASGAIAAERHEDFGPTNQPLRLHRRHDEPGDRLTWQFSARQEFVLPPSDKNSGGSG